ncbi:ATP-binding protein [Salinibacterium sp. NK8237]|uniref:ATP-binding protein n=1 Tax=Salinibacterium sp. NK8237 TaxID=2792038 RepID=UPI0018CEAA90|nr:ATP-binding protein [Salinibacterium sp. NK8237]MBH0131008.1 ATP-binding protein [Salinibacterium sp. NK8237]
MPLDFNPYDFANPVQDGDVFAGRKAQRDDVKYYLNQARWTRPMHLALTGERSAGKTSMLNMVAQQAKMLDFSVVRFDLNIGDATPTPFFQRLYDAILLAIVKEGHFGGIEGRTWCSYRDLVDSGVHVGDLPLRFPSHVCAVMDGTRPLSIAVLTDDLLAIQAESTKKIVVILDECDVLSSSPETLQILRNLFTVLDRFMFVIAGTPRLFPVIDDVFSPIVRQFKKVSISAFEDEAETEACILQPLEIIGIEPNDLIANRQALVNEIHDLTGGRPYEIQLLCHTMFRRVQEGSEPYLIVNLEALEQVRLDLEHSQAHNLGRMSHLYAGLKPSSLVAIQMIQRVRDATRDSAFTGSVLEVSNGAAELSKAEFCAEVDHLLGLGVIEESDSNLRLLGDQFDEVYLRYSAASRNVFISAFPVPLEVVFGSELRDVLGFDKDHVPHNSWSQLSVTALQKRIVGMLSQETGDGAGHHGYQDWISLYPAIYQAQREGRDHFIVSSYIAELQGVTLAAYFPLMKAGLEEDVVSDSVEQFKSRVSNFGGELRVVDLRISLDGVGSLETLLPVNENIARSAGYFHERQGFSAYREGEFEESLIQFKKAIALRASAGRAIAAAFQLLLLGRWAEAVEMSDLSMKYPVEREAEYLRPLADFDAAVAHVMLGEFQKSETRLEAVIASKASVAERDTIYLVTAVRDEDSSFVVEQASGEVREVAAQLLAAIRA